METIRSCGAIVFRDNPEPEEAGGLQVLLVRYGHHHWGYPKGQMEAGETEEETVLREVLEETGLEVNILPGFREMTGYRNRKGDLRENVFFVAIPGDPSRDPVPQLSELTDARWMDDQEVEPLVSFPGDYEVYLKARDVFLNGLERNRS